MTIFDPATVAAAVREEIENALTRTGVKGTTDAIGATKARRLRVFNMVGQQDPHVYATVHLLHDRHPSEGDRTRKTKVDGALDEHLKATPRLRRQIEAIVRKHERLERRDAAILAAGGSLDRPPAWAFSHHDVMPALLSMCGTSIDRIFTDASFTAIPEGWRINPKRGNAGAIYDGMKGIGDRFRVRNMSVFEGSNLAMRLDQSKTAQLLVTCDGLPDTMLQAMAGMPLRSALGHAEFEKHETRSVIDSVSNASPLGGIVVSLKDQREWPPAPDGIDLSWRT